MNFGARKEEVLRRVDILRTVRKWFPKSKKTGNELLCLCPFHEEDTPSLSVNLTTGFFKCFGCEASGDLIHLTMHMQHMKNALQALDWLAESVGISTSKDEHIKWAPKVTEFEAVQKRLWEDQDVLSQLKERTLTEETIKAEKLGARNGKVVFPIFSKKGKLISLKMHKGQQTTGATYQLYPWAALEGDNIVLCEGEFDRLVLTQNGYNAITPTAGSDSWETSWSSEFEDKNVSIVFDNDSAGRRGAVTAAKGIASFANSVTVAIWGSDVPKGYDVSDLYMAGGTLEDLKWMTWRRGMEEKEENALREVPADEVAEKLIICELLENKEAALEVFDVLSPQDFEDRNLGTVYSVMVKAANENIPLDMLVLKDLVREADVRTLGTFDKLKPVKVTPEVAVSHAKIIHSLAVRRRIIEEGSTVIESAYDRTTPVEAVVKKTRDWAVTVESMGSQSAIIGMDSLLQRRWEGIEERRNAQIVLSGFFNMDPYLTHGFAPGQISIIAGRPSMGKSAWKTNLVSNLCEAGFGVASFCVEQDFLIEAERMDALRSGIPLHQIARIKDWHEDDPRFAQLKVANEYMARRWKLFYDETPDIDTKEAVLHMMKMELQSKVNVAFIDLFDRFSDIAVTNNKPATVANRLRYMSAVAKQLKIHICLVVQISRGVEMREDKRPTMADLKDSGAYEEYADIVFLLYRQKYYNKKTSDPTRVDVIIGKQRHGATPTCTFDIEYSTLAFIPRKKVEEEESITETDAVSAAKEEEQTGAFNEEQKGG